MKELKFFLDELNMQLEKNYEGITDPKYYIWDNNAHKIIGEGNSEKDIVETIVEYNIRKYNYNEITLRNLYIQTQIKYCNFIIEKQNKKIEKLKKQFLMSVEEVEVLKDFCDEFGYKLNVDNNKYSITSKKSNIYIPLTNNLLKSLGYEISSEISSYKMLLDKEYLYQKFLNLARRRGVIK